MVKKESLLTDVKTITRDPVLMILFLLPLLIPFIFKAILYYTEPLFYQRFLIDISEYYYFIQAAVFLIVPLMLGTVTAFIIIDERDSKIQELLSITPIGYRGYLFNRLLLPFVVCFIYTYFVYFAFSLVTLHLQQLLLLSVLLASEGLIIALLLAGLAADKVQGLTYAKGLNVFFLFAFSDLLNSSWFQFTSKGIPFYWITQIIINYSLHVMIIAIMIHLLYGYIILKTNKI